MTTVIAPSVAVRRFWRLTWLLLVALTVGCGDTETDPEQSLRNLIGDAEIAAENRDIGTLGDMVAAEYLDASGHDRRTVIRLVQGYLIRHGAVHLFTVVKDIVIEPEDRARALVFVAMAGRPIETLAALEQVRAELMRFEIDFVRDHDWRVTAARWRRASVADFF